MWTRRLPSLEIPTQEPYRLVVYSDCGCDSHGPPVRHQASQRSPLGGRHPGSAGGSAFCRRDACAHHNNQLARDGYPRPNPQVRRSKHPHAATPCGARPRALFRGSSRGSLARRPLRSSAGCASPRDNDGADSVFRASFRSSTVRMLHDGVGQGHVLLASGTVDSIETGGPHLGWCSGSTANSHDANERYHSLCVAMKRPRCNQTRQKGPERRGGGHASEAVCLRKGIARYRAVPEPSYRYCM